MSEKIDSILLNKVNSQNLDGKIQCIVKSNNFQFLKNKLKQKKIEVIKEYPFISSLLVEVKKKDLVNVSKFSQVKFISSISSYSTLTYLSKKIIKSSESGLTGKGVGIAVIDTGIAPHPDFYIGRKVIKEFVDFVGERKMPYDDNGHGTFVSGVLCGNGSESAGRFSGIATGVDLYSLKALDENGEADSNKILDAMSWVYDNHKKKNIKVVCMSFGSQSLGVNDPIMKGAEVLWSKGVCVVCAGGNSGPEFQTITSPGTSPKLITVGGLEDNRFDEFEYDPNLFEIADFSSRGPAFSKIKPDIIAPSVDIKSCSNKGGYKILSGTSVSAPMVAGGICLLLEKKPNLNPNMIKSMLLKHAKPITFNKLEEGFGLIDFSKILN